jgi:L-amino acid N-acyltransferase YncA
MTVEIREATADDAEGILGVLNPIIVAGTFTILDTPFSVEEERTFIRNLHQRGIFNVAVATADNTIVGFQIVDPLLTYTHACDHVGTIGTYVTLASRRQGIAKALFRATLARAVEEGYEKLFTFVRADNPAALEVYTRQGFRIIGTAARHAKVNGVYVDEIMIERFL